MKFGDAIIFTENGVEYQAVILASRVLDDHMGLGDEPLVQLAFFKPITDGAGNVLNVLGTSRQLELVQFRTDVAHESHEFSEEVRAASLESGKIDLPASYPGGRWRKVGPVVLPAVVSPGLEVSAEDLDAHAAEEKAKEDTSGKKETVN